MSQKIAAVLGVPVKDLYGLVIADREKLQCFANLHFTSAGSQRMGQHIAARILESLSQEPCLEEQEAHVTETTPVHFCRSSEIPLSLSDPLLLGEGSLHLCSHRASCGVRKAA